MTINEAVQIIWDYHHMGHSLEAADCLLVLGSMDTRVAERAAELFKENLAPLIVVSGGYGRFTTGIFKETEAETFTKFIVASGVPEGKILLEKEATNTGENFTLSMRLLESKSIYPKDIILVTKPYMERRAYATCKKLYPNTEIQVTSPQLSWNDYPDEVTPKDEVISIMVGDLERIIEYPKRGFQIAQNVPAKVVEAMKFLIAQGYDKYLIKD